MSDQKAENIKQEIMATYLKRTKKSKAVFDKACGYLPGANTRTVTHYSPYPFYAAKGRGCRIYDQDGNEYLDFINNITSLLHGHAHPHMIKAINSQMEMGTAHGTACEIQYKLAKLICDRIPYMDMLRFCNSGTEATMGAMQAARGFTKKNGFVRIDGGYNGSHDFVSVNIIPDLEPGDLPKAAVELGISPSVLNDIHIAPFNNADAVEKILKKHGNKIAGILVEPMLGAGGLIMPVAGYLERMRELADQYGVLLIFDEVITFRFHAGGMQTMMGIKPDLTCLGKTIGGGLPVGAFGGRRDIMEQYNPEKPEHIVHAGTFNGNALTMAGGFAALEIFDQKEIDRINGLGDRLRKGFEDAMASAGIKGKCMGFGSLVGPLFTDQTIKESKDVILATIKIAEINKYIHLEIINNGTFFVPWGNLHIISTPMTEKEIDRAIGVFGAALEKVKILAPPHIIG